MITNNKNSIVRGWKKLYIKYKVNKFAQFVERVTGDYPDSKTYQSSFENEYKGMTEDELINSNYKFK